MATRRPKNESEGSCFDMFSERGWEVLKRGWPDFLCLKRGAVMAVEVKKTKSQSLRWDQIKVMRVLMRFGVPCYRYNGDEKKLVRLTHKTLDYYERKLRLYRSLRRKKLEKRSDGKLVWVDRDEGDTRVTTH